MSTDDDADIEEFGRFIIGEESALTGPERAQLVKDVYETGDPLKLQTLVTQGTKNPDTWPVYRDAGIADALIKLVCERADHGPEVPEFIVPTWNFPLQGLLGIARKTLDGSDTESVFREPWDGPTNSKMRDNMGRVLRRVLTDRRLKYAQPRADVAEYLYCFLEACNTEWIRSVPEIWEFVWKSWALDSLGDDDETNLRYEFSAELSHVLRKLSPDLLPNSLPVPPISADNTVKRGLALMQKLPEEEYKLIFKHLATLSEISRLYPSFARAFLEGGLLSMTAAAISISNETSGSMSGSEGSIINLWNAMINTDKDEKAQTMLFKALEKGFMECFSFVAIRCTNDYEIVSCVACLDTILEYTKCNPVLARRLAQTLIFTLPRMDRYRTEAPFPSVRAIGSAYMTFAKRLEDAMGAFLKSCAWDGCPRRAQVATNSDDAPQHRCSKCKSVHYCGPTCQAG
ncbi:hypothetical protein DFH11DRAFT_1599441 [Phellopilus nigrolimitatus]|nr:hypothetical protein DFH11DRAFT_1599441 [Phellopilus nigrolimitatus]